MHNLASNNKHSHGVEGSETSPLQCFAGSFWPSTITGLDYSGLDWWTDPKNNFYAF